MSVKLLRRRFTVDEYHAACVDRLNRVFSLRVGDHAVVRVQNPIWLGSRSEPQPDLALLRPRADFYASAHPAAADVLLVDTGTSAGSPAATCSPSGRSPESPWRLPR